jgi:DNA-binding NarL/FixJ family response regulator
MRILVVSDHILFREGLVALLEQQTSVTVVGAIKTGQEVLERVGLLKPDFVIMDLDWPHSTGVETIREINLFHPETKVIVLTHSESDELLFASIQGGAKGYLFKDIPVAKLLRSMTAIERGEAALSRSMTKRIIDEFLRLSIIHNSTRHASPSTLTQREQEILELITQGATNHEIANHLSISYSTVKIHIHNILNKFQMRNRSELISFVQRQRR